ncbi:patched domain-containing protein 3-like [Xenia sp. Carnegie-2017]|uniref:patched domain-containing protein 3-like n=1 Tax=Xenia sp. Carnegie-2017 TaxID=2897299 RepID=UPI001F048720|nr:patched domain-containing protein 3-like [Xenia sp. Carnegie-2017]XP_046861199.1 patched domain-containing protein 3-like [Xenia sp. Carnegie-2017]
MTAVVLGGSIYGSMQLEQQYEAKWFLPTGTSVRNYMEINDEKFLEGGQPTAFYTGEIDYFKEQKLLHKLNNNLRSEMQYLASNTTVNWFEKYIQWLKKTKPVYLDNLTMTVSTKNKFYEQLKIFLNSKDGRRHRNDIIWNKSMKVIKAARTRAFLKVFRKSKYRVEGMIKLRNIIESIGFSLDPIVYGEWVLFAETSKVIAEELFRNILFAMAAIFIVNFVFIASPLTSLLVCFCVILTVVDVAGMMYFWDLTIETVSFVVLIISIGLSVDYASHVGHTFMTKSGTRKERTVKIYRDIAPAVWNGGFSTFLAIAPLVFSKSHVFITFFKILFGVIIFGMFHGLIVLPVILSIIGSSPYDLAEKMENSSMSGNVSQEQNINTLTVLSHTNEGLQDGDDVQSTI